MSELLQKMNAHYAQKFKARFNPSQQLTTGDDAIDAMWAGGFVEGRHYMLGGPRDAGKTKFAIWTIWQLMKLRHAQVDWFSTEMTAEALTASLMGPGYHLTVNEALELRPSSAEVQMHGDMFSATTALTRKVVETNRQIAQMRGQLHYHRVGGDVTVEHVVAQIERRKIEHSASQDERPYLVVVDCLQNVPLGRYAHSESEEIGHTSLALTAACKHHNIPMLSLVQTQPTNPHRPWGSARMEMDADIFNTIMPTSEHPGGRLLGTALSRHHEPLPPLLLDADLNRAIFKSINRSTR